MKTEKIYRKLLDLLNSAVYPFDFTLPKALNEIVERVGEARIVLMGEATHGTQEFYLSRVELSKKLIEQKGFQAIAIEGDWTSAAHIQRYIQMIDETPSATESLAAFQRFPAWMWRNTAVLDFLSWLKKFNQNAKQKINFYGLDLYCLHDSMQAVIQYLDKHDPKVAEHARHYYRCFDHVAMDPQMYGYLVNQNIKQNCVKEVTETLLEIQNKHFNSIKNNSSEQEELYYATQNARVVKNAEEYYRSMFLPRASSWNIRDRHMSETLGNIISHLETINDKPAKIIVWAHNSHVGDARATEMNDRGEINLGQLVREQYDKISYLLGFSTYAGTVCAASNWDAPVERKKILPAMAGSYEALFHDVSSDNFYLDLKQDSHLIELLKSPQLQRAIGVIYLPESERLSHYYFSRLPYQFDGIIHFDKTQALMPLDKISTSTDELPETYPSGI